MVPDASLLIPMHKPGPLASFAMNHLAKPDSTPTGYAPPNEKVSDLRDDTSHKHEPVSTFANDESLESAKLFLKDDPERSKSFVRAKAICNTPRRRKLFVQADPAKGDVPNVIVSAGPMQHESSMKHSSRSIGPPLLGDSSDASLVILSNCISSIKNSIFGANHGKRADDTSGPSDTEGNWAMRNLLARLMSCRGGHRRSLFVICLPISRSTPTTGSSATKGARAAA